MSDKTAIEWTDATWNPIRGTKGRHHCVRISEGCKNCYAATMNHRFQGPDYVVGADTPRLDEKALLEPLKWKKPRRIFVCSMTDLFLDAHTDEMIGRVWGVMEQASQHTFQVLTKRSGRMSRMLYGRFALPNVWLGVSAENAERFDERVPDLCMTPAAVRFVSLEPLLGPIRLPRYATDPADRLAVSGVGGRLDWVIVGGESGVGNVRSCRVEWVRDIKDQCEAAGVAVFVKQLGSYAILDPRYDRQLPGKATRRLHDPKGGDPSEWPEDLRVRQMPEV